MSNHHVGLNLLDGFIKTVLVAGTLVIADITLDNGRIVDAAGRTIGSLFTANKSITDQPKSKPVAPAGIAKNINYTVRYARD